MASVLSSCGNQVLCKKCATTIKNYPKTQRHHCLLCNTNIRDIVTEYKEEHCAICLDCPCDCIFLPCGHYCTCFNCGRIILKHNKKCPLFQTQICSFKHCFNIPEETIISPTSQLKTSYTLLNESDDFSNCLPFLRNNSIPPILTQGNLTILRLHSVPLISSFSSLYNSKFMLEMFMNNVGLS